MWMNVITMMCMGSLLACACQTPSAPQTQRSIPDGTRSAAHRDIDDSDLICPFRENFIVLRGLDEDMDRIEMLLLEWDDVLLVDRVPDQPLLRLMGRHASLSVGKVLRFVRAHGFAIEPASERVFNDAYLAADRELRRRGSVPGSILLEPQRVVGNDDLEAQAPAQTPADEQLAHATEKGS